MLTVATTADPLREVRDVRERLRNVLAEVADLAGGLTSLPRGEQARTMRAIVATLDDRLRPHLEWEERTLHPAVDRLACGGPTTFSTSMRYEHEVIFRWIDELARRSRDGSDPVAFTRRTDNLIGVVLAHFELEEQVFFPILSRHWPASPSPPGAGEPGR